MIEIWVDGLSEPVNPAWARTACFGYIIRKSGKTIYNDCGVIGKGDDMTNNVGEYTALILALEKIRSLKLDNEKIVVKADSQLVAYGMGRDPSIGRSWKIKSPRVAPLHTKAKILAAGMNITFQWIPREQNEEADGLCRLAYGSKRSSL
jgi:ribonuclease HI